jgi:hypothetical protein
MRVFNCRAKEGDLGEGSGILEKTLVSVWRERVHVIFCCSDGGCFASFSKVDGG